MQNQSQMQGFRIWIAIVLALGIFFRFAHLDQKPYWQDETYTLLRISGHKLTDANQQIYTGQVIDVEDIQRYQQLLPDANAIDTIHRLAEEVPQHPPLYFVLAQFWTQFWMPWMGDSVAALRSFSAVVSLLGFPAIYWLCLELFATPSVGWMAMGLYAVSPLYIRYAQEARPYSLWIVLILLSSVALLRAARIRNLQSWGVYAITIAAAFYCHLLSSFVILAHGIYILAVERFRLGKLFLSYLAAALCGAALFLPWFWVIWTNRSSAILTTAWADVPLPLPSLIRIWGLHLCQTFIAWHLQYNSILIYLAVPLSILIAYAIAHLSKRASKPVWLFIISLICIPILILCLPDLIWTGRRSSNIRYFLSSLLGIHLAISYFLTDKISQTIVRPVQRVWKIITVLLISGSVLTSAVSVEASTWWGWSEYDVEIGRIVNQASHPIVISDMPIGVVLPLSHQLNPQTKLLLLREPEALILPNGFSDVFVYHPSQRLQSVLQQRGIKSKPVYRFSHDSFTLVLYSVEP